MRKKADLPTTNDLESLINDLKLSKPQSYNKLIDHSNYQSIVKIPQESKVANESRSQFQSVIEDDYSNYKCFEQLEKEYLVECKEWQIKKPQIGSKVILSSPIYRLTEQKRHSPFCKDKADGTTSRKGHLRPTLSTNSKQRPGLTKQCKVRRQLFSDKENNINTNNMLDGRTEKGEVGRVGQAHKFSNCQQFLRWK